MVHLAFFDNFTIPFPLPHPHTMLGQCAQSVPLEAALYGGGGGGERGGPSLGKRAAVIIEQGTIMKTLQIFKVYHILLTRIVDPGRHQENISAGIEHAILVFGSFSEQFCLKTMFSMVVSKRHCSETCHIW